MKKKLVIVLTLVLVIVVIKYFTGNYTITYKVGDYSVKEVVKDSDIYVEVTDKDGVIYNFLKNGKRNFTKKMVSKITSEDGCIKPNGFYYVCNSDTLEVKDLGVSYVKNLKDFNFNGNLNSNEHVLIWKYDGFYYLNGSEYKTINIFKKDRYSNDLMIIKDKYLVFPNYSEEYMFDGFIIMDVSTGKYKEFSTNFSISYESEYVGEKGSNLYLFDKKNNNLIEINVKKAKAKIVGDKINGYFKYDGLKKVRTKLSEYTSGKVNFFNKKEEVLSVNSNYLFYKYNKEVKTKFFTEEVNVVSTNKDKVYFIYKDNLYSYSMGKVKEIAHYFELNFNSKDNVFTYIK